MNKSYGKQAFLSIIFLLMLSHQAAAQKPVIRYEIEAQATGTTNNVVPFWMRSNQFGSIPLSGASASFIGRAHKDYNSNSDSTGKKKLTDWGFGFEGRANAGNGSNLILVEAYGKFRLGVFQFKAGRTKDVMGLNGDTTLSSGNFSVSGNALGIPKVEISIPEYYTIPILGGLFSFKGNFVHGWVGKARIIDKIAAMPPDKSVYQILDNHPTTYFHQKSFYGRIGKPDWKLKIYGGINHQVYWGSEDETYGPNFKLSPIQTFFYAVTGKTYGAAGVPTSKIGNQIGSVDLGVEYNFKDMKVLLYRQNFYDVGALAKLANIADGLNGVSLENKNFKPNGTNFQWRKILLEVFYSKDQAGYPWSKPTKSGDEDYYNNFFYPEGWSYKLIGLGNPLVTVREDAKAGQASSKLDYFINNRVIAYHAGFEGQFNKWFFLTKITYSKNYGTFGTSIYGNSTGDVRSPQTTNIFVPVDQLSLYLEGMRPIKNSYSAGFAAALDQGKLLNNSFGAILKLKKAF